MKMEDLPKGLATSSASKIAKRLGSVSGGRILDAGTANGGFMLFDVEYLAYKRKMPFLIPRPKPVLAWFSQVLSSAPPVKNPKDKALRQLELFSLTLTSISLIGLVFMVLLILFYKTETDGSKQFVNLAFIVICSLGASAAVVPSRCSRLLHGKKSEVGLAAGTSPNGSTGQVLVKGHHPTCGSFDNHVLHLGAKTYCAGCLGLLAGALFSIAGSLAYMSDFFKAQSTVELFLWIGVAGVLLGLLQYLGPLTLRASVHFVLNVIFVFATFPMLMAIVEMNGGFVVEIYFLALVLYWVLTRIILSNREHRRICFACGSALCAYGGR